MSTLTERPAAVRAWHQAGKVFVELADGRVVDFPVAANARLRGGTPDQLNRIEISPYGLHWPELDEDLSTAGILSGRYGRRVSAAGFSCFGARSSFRARSPR